MSNPRVFVLSGPSGAGKSTLIQGLREDASVHLSVSATTRAPRPGEVDGVDYHFTSRDRFEHLRDEGGFLEWAEVHGHLYGTPLSEFEKPGAEVVILDIDVQGYRLVRSSAVEVTGIFIAPPSLEALERRLVERGTESQQDLWVRLDNAATEMAAQDEYDHVVVNDEKDEAVARLRSLLGLTGGGGTDVNGARPST